MNRVALAIGAAAAAGLAAGAAWWLLTPGKLGLDAPRVVMTSGEVTVDDHRARPRATTLAAGAVVKVGSLSGACFSVHASRVCLGAGTQLRLASLEPHGATLALERGSVILAPARDTLKITAGDASVSTAEGLVALEGGPGGPADSVVRVLEGSATIERPGKPPASVAGGAVGLRDGAVSPPMPAVATEERGIALLAAKWQGSAGAVVEIERPGARATVDGNDAGRTPLSILLNEGRHSLVLHDGARESARETLELKAGQTVTRGG